MVDPDALERRMLRELRRRCRDVIFMLEGDGSVMVSAENEGYEPTLELIHRVSREAFRDMVRVAWRAKKLGYGPIDPNVVVARRLALYYAAWYAWVCRAKSMDRKRAKHDRDEYHRSHRAFPRELEAAVRVGTRTVRPILRKRGMQ